MSYRAEVLPLTPVYKLLIYIVFSPVFHNVLLLPPFILITFLLLPWKATAENRFLYQLPIVFVIILCY